MEITTADGTHLNTALATEVGRFSNGRRPNDPQHSSETLFKQKTVWFLRRRTNGKDELIPLLPDQAATWLSQKHFIGALGFHFGESVKRTPASVL